MKKTHTKQQISLVDQEKKVFSSPIHHEKNKTKTKKYAKYCSVDQLACFQILIEFEKKIITRWQHGCHQ